MSIFDILLASMETLIKLEQFAGQENIQSDLKRLEQILLNIQELIGNAEEKLTTEELVRIWLGKLKNLAAEVEDILVKIEPEDLLKKLQIEQAQTSLVNEAELNGREKDKEAIVELLLRDDLSSDEKFSVIPIIGVEGVGKTTLAQLVCNDVLMKDRFDLKVWEWVSEDFDVIRVTKIILRSDHPVKDDDFNLLQEELKKKLFEKKFLIVLDDVWNKNYNDWTEFSCLFDADAPGSKIIVTTSNRDVAEMKGIAPAYLQKGLSNDDCLRVLAQHSSRKRDFIMHQS